ncbi:MAG: tetratricopeptide repeat protein, partial [Thermodesulfobacteriota bacterium]
ALGEYEATVRLDPGFVEAVNNMGVIYRENGSYDMAIGTFKKALEIDAYNPAVNYNIAVAYDMSGDTEMARRHYTTFLFTAPAYYGGQLRDARRRLMELKR